MAGTRGILIAPDDPGLPRMLLHAQLKSKTPLSLPTRPVVRAARIPAMHSETIEQFRHSHDHVMVGHHESGPAGWS